MSIYRIMAFNLPENCPKMLNSFAVDAFLRQKEFFDQKYIQLLADIFRSKLERSFLILWRSVADKNTSIYIQIEVKCLVVDIRTATISVTLEVISNILKSTTKVYQTRNKALKPLPTMHCSITTHNLHFQQR